MNSDTTQARHRTIRTQLWLFLAGMGLLGVASGMFETTFNNYVADQFNLKADARGFLEFPRELPGFLTALFAGLLFFAPETCIAGIAALALGVGMVGLSIWGSNWTAMLVFMTLWSIGAHLIMPVRSSIGMNLAHPEEKGRRLGQIGGVGIAASIAGCAMVWLVVKHLGHGYSTLFWMAGLVAFAAAVFLFAMRMPDAHLERPKFVWHKAYRLYYVQQLLFGARKQIFITFAPWLLVKVFHQPVWVFAQLGIAAAVLGLFVQPALGRAIDRFGERAVLLWDAVLTLVVCLGYAFGPGLPYRTAALGLLYACLVGDQLLFGTGMARDTYLARIVRRPEHLSPTLSLGVTINHVVSMTIPALGGLLWVRVDPRTVFLCAAGVAVLMFVTNLFVQPPARSRTRAA